MKLRKQENTENLWEKRSPMHLQMLKTKESPQEQNPHSENLFEKKTPKAEGNETPTVGAGKSQKGGSSFSSSRSHRKSNTNKEEKEN